jgi:hypothetical protein
VKTLDLNAGAQLAFFNDESRATAFIGGLGSGKTFADIAKGLKYAAQPKQGFYGPRGCLAAINYPVLKDVVLPQFMEMVDGTGMLLDYVKSEKKALLVPFNEHGEPDRTLVKKNGLGASEVLFRSLDQPNWMRGLELSWFGIDEGRHLSGEAWDVLYGRLRQQGYKHGGWVCSTPNGYDWMWTKFHPDSKRAIKGAKWYGAPTFDNRDHLPAEYIDSLVATYEGRFLRQEVYGEFVGVVDGAVFFGWDHARHTQRVDFDGDLDLYSFWDFGMGDLGVVIYAQVEWIQSPRVASELVPSVRCLDVLEATDRTSAEWARVHIDHCNRRYGRLPRLNIGDPAGMQRNVSTGTSYIEDANAAGVVITPAQKRPIDHGIRILNNLLEADEPVRFVVDEDRCERLAQAMASHKWPIDSNGVRTGVNPVHDWTSHFADALRYGMTMLVGYGARKNPGYADEMKTSEDRSSWGYINKELDRLEGQEAFGWLGQEREHNARIDWTPGRLGPRSR